MSSPTCHVVVGYDFSHSGHAALTRAVALAGRAHCHVLHVVCAVDEGTPLPSIPATDGTVDYMYAARVQEALAVAVQQELDAQQVTARVDFFVHARIGKTAETILDVAREIGADLIIVGHHDVSGLERLLVGSVGEKIVREAGCSVEIARAKAYKDVELMPVEEVEPDHAHPYVPPHRYRYEDRRVTVRPDEWPLM